MSDEVRRIVHEMAMQCWNATVIALEKSGGERIPHSDDFESIVAPYIACLAAQRDAARRCAATNPDWGEESGCTGLTAIWCPIHGDCSCGHGGGPAIDIANMDDADCPLHGIASDHAEAEREYVGFPGESL